MNKNTSKQYSKYLFVYYFLLLIKSVAPMNSIQAMKKEIRYQIDQLPKLNLPKQANLDDCLIIGAGDSYAAALIAQYVSNHRAKCITPMDIVFDPEIVTGSRRLYIISVSGNTKSNILAANISRKQNVPTTAITTMSESKLAKNCDEVIELHYNTTGIPTSGTISFTASVLCCLALLGANNNLDHFLKKSYRKINDDVNDMIASSAERISSYIFLGEGLLFPVVIYGALKINEVFGVKSFAYPLEEFCHSPIFSIKRTDEIVILGNKSQGNITNEKLNKRLKELGLNSIYLECANDNTSTIETLLKSIMLLQLFVVKQAIRKRIKNCFFLKNKGLLKLSSTFIYGSDV
jgi:fructoselysine-6-P-deglycase FrlB-like protein